VEAVGVVFSDGGRVYSFDPAGLDLAWNERVICQTSRGQEFGRVVQPNHELDGEPPAPLTRRPVHFDELDDAVDTPVYDRAALPAGCTLEGPAVVQQLDSTILVPPGVEAAVDEHLIIRMEIAP
jgi:N-methylhydantoinase A/oxoprolinase/acetone carboxylase beta subunit